MTPMTKPTEDSEHFDGESDLELDDEFDRNDPNIEALLEAIAAVTKERDDAKDQAIRAMAELQNVRRRSQEQIEQNRRMATERLALSLLPVLDNFERSIEALRAGATVEAVMEGIQGIDKQMRAALETVQVTRILAKGAPFDPELHEAVGTVENDALPEGSVHDELEAGYTMAGQVVRPAKVRVTTKP